MVKKTNQSAPHSSAFIAVPERLRGGAIDFPWPAGLNPGMTLRPTRPPLRILVACLGWASILTAGDLPTATPESVGVSTARLETMHQFVAEAVESYPLTGAITLIARRGKVIDWQTYGYQDKLKGVPMEKDAIFALASMTKTIVSAGAMLLVEQGKIRLSDPVSKYLPEFRDPQVFVRLDASGPVTRPAMSSMQIRHLLTHTAGWAAGPGDGSDLARLYSSNGYRDASSLEEMAERLGQLPLQDDPGTAYVYGPAIDVLGALIQRVSGQPLEAFLKQHLFEPLGMEDTFFTVPTAKRHRLTQVFKREKGELAYAVDPAEHGTMRRGFASGGGGLYSTVPDYFRFAQMLLNKGSYEGRVVLGKKTVESMMRNQTGFLGDGVKSNNLSEAYGYGGSVKIDTFYEKDMSSVGTYGWGGAVSTWYRIDPEEAFIAMFFSQHLPMSSSLMPPFANTAWQAIIE